MAFSPIREARRLHALGFAILWLHPRDKRPIGSGWTKGPRKTWPELKAEYREGFNVGVRTGDASKLEEGYLACIDVDVKDPVYMKEAEKALNELVGFQVLPEVSSGGGNGSRHLYCVTAKPFKMITVAKHKQWEICVYSNGRQMVLPPSIHPSGRAYKWVEPLNLINGEIPRLDFSQIETEEKPKKKTEPRDEFTRETIGVVPGIDVRTFAGISTKIKKLIVYGIWNGTQITDRSAYLLTAANALASGGLLKSEVLGVLTDRTTFLGQCAYDHAKTSSREKAALWLWNYTVKRVMGERDAKSVFAGVVIEDEILDTQDEIEEQSKGIKSMRQWEQDLKRGKSTEDGPGKVIDTLNNLDMILSNGVKQPLFQKNEFTNRENYAVNAPWGAKKGADLGDIDVVLIKSWLANSKWGLEPKKQNIEDAMALLAHRHRTHPVRDWLNSLKWDGTPRASSWIKDYLNGHAPEPYLSDVSKKFLIAMVARIFEPGCQWDYTLILEGEQGTRKSTAARILASDKWFCDHLPDLKDKDAMLNLQGSWLVELGELKNVKHADAATVKAYLTRRIDRVRAPYGHRWVDAPRQSVFIGTVNENEYFKDPTGNRRFWPVAVGRCDVESLARDRDQLFAEAKFLYDQRKEKLFLEGAALSQALVAQDDRRIDDDESEMKQALLEYMELPEEERGIQLDRFRMKELFESNGAPWVKWASKNYSFQNGAQVLRNLKFARTSSAGQRIWRLKKDDFDPKKRSTPVAEVADFY